MFRFAAITAACVFALGLAACESSGAGNGATEDSATAASATAKEPQKKAAPPSSNSGVCQEYFRRFETCQAFPQAARASMQANIEQWKLALQSADDDRRKMLEKSCKQALEGLEIAGCK